MIDINITKHVVAFPTKIAAGSAGSPHILNIELQQATEQGAIRGVGEYITLDLYKDTAAPSGDNAFAGKIVEKSARGYWYVQLTKTPKDTVFIYQDVVIPEAGYGRKFGKEENFYNAKGDVVRGYLLEDYDIFEVSAEAFVGTPVVGKAVTANAAGKLVVGN